MTSTTACDIGFPATEDATAALRIEVGRANALLGIEPAAPAPPEPGSDPLAALTALPDAPTPAQVELALREFAAAAGPDLLRRATLRGAAATLLDARKLRGAAAIVDAALGTTAQSAPEAGNGTPLALPSPEPWPTPVDGAQLIGDLVAAVRRHVILNWVQATAVALWLIFAHAIDGARIAPKLAITSPTPRCGKSTLLAIIATLVPRPLPASNISPAAVFRAIEAARPTLLVDEADTFLRDNEELRGVLNSGHSRDGAYVIRCVGEDLEPRRFSTWCAQAVGLIGSLPTTLADRSIEVRLERKRTAEHVAKLTTHARAGLAMLARQAARWAADNPIGDIEPEMPAGLNDRAVDNWTPLLAIAYLAGGEWPERARKAALELSGGEPADAQAVGVVLLGDIKGIFEGRGVDRLPSADVVAVLVAMENRPWPEWRHGKAMTPRQVARQLHPFGIEPRSQRDGSTVQRGYEKADFAAVWERYLTPEKPPDTPYSPEPPSPIRYSATTRVNTGQSDDSASATATQCSGCESGVSPNAGADCSSVADGNPQSVEKKGIEAQAALFGGEA